MGVKTCHSPTSSWRLWDCLYLFVTYWAHFRTHWLAVKRCNERIIVQLSPEAQISKRRSSTIYAVVERPDHHCGDDLVNASECRSLVFCWHFQSGVWRHQIEGSYGLSVQSLQSDSGMLLPDRSAATTQPHWAHLLLRHVSPQAAPNQTTTNWRSNHRRQFQWVSKGCIGQIDCSLLTAYMKFLLRLYPSIIATSQSRFKVLGGPRLAQLTGSPCGGGL